MDPECSTSSSSSPPSSSRRPFALPASLRHACARPSPRRQRILIPSMLDAGSESGSGNVFNRQRQDTAATQVNSATVSPDDAAAAAVAASGETDVERRSRERVEYWAASLFQNSPMIRFMTRHLRMVGCDPYHQVDMASDPSAIPRLAIQSCPDAMAGGFTPSEKGQAYSNAGIVICSNHILNKKHLEQTLAHEMIHWWDHCRFRVDWGDLRQHACSEVSERGGRASERDHGVRLMLPACSCLLPRRFAQRPSRAIAITRWKQPARHETSSASSSTIRHVCVGARSCPLSTRRRVETAKRQSASSTRCGIVVSRIRGPLMRFTPSDRGGGLRLISLSLLPR